MTIGSAMDELTTRPDQAQIHPLTLRFCDRDLEAGFRAARAGANLRQLRVSLLIAAALNIGFAPLDYLVLTQNVFTALIIRVPIATAIFLVVLGLFYSPFFRGGARSISRQSQCSASRSHTRR